MIFKMVILMTLSTSSKLLTNGFLMKSRHHDRAFCLRMEAEYSASKDIPSWKKRTETGSAAGDRNSNSRNRSFEESSSPRTNSRQFDVKPSINSQASSPRVFSERRSPTLENKEDQNKQYSRRAPSSNTNFGQRKRPDFSRDEKNEFYANEYGRADRGEPPYGYYDGDHVFGVSPVRLALLSKRRKFTELLMQTGTDSNNKKDQKSFTEILNLCQKMEIPIREFTKHDLNMLTDSRPHQGFVLRASPRTFVPIDSLAPSEVFKCVLVLDEVWDPQNFGALLRTSHFLGCDKVITCAKNSAPLSPSVSKASSGAMELMEIYSANNLMKFLDKSRDNGWQVVGTSLSPSAVGLDQISLDKPTILVLGNEGHGIRTNILRRCTQQIKISSFSSIIGSNQQTNQEIPSNDVPVISDGILPVEMMISDTSTSSSSDSGFEEEAVDSLNVSVTGGIILHHMLRSMKKAVIK